MSGFEHSMGGNGVAIRFANLFCRAGWITGRHMMLARILVLPTCWHLPSYAQFNTDDRSVMPLV